MKNPYSRAALKEVFGTPGASYETINRWRATWSQDSDKQVAVNSFGTALAMLEEHSIDPLFYQFTSSRGGTDSTTVFYIVFYKPEHQVFFKLHNSLA